MEWISVKSRLPEVGVPVLCLKKSKDCFIGTYLGASYTDGYAAFRHTEKYMAIGVSHWMYLPEAPKD